MSFATVFSRGFAAANRTPVGLLFLLLILGVQQLVGAVAAVAQPQPGMSPEREIGPEIFVPMALGCFSCVWLFVILFGMPWVLGGVFGQLRDRIAKPEGKAGAFAQYGNAFYLQMLLILLIFVGIAIVIMVPLIVGSMAFAFSQMAGGAPDPQQMQKSMTENPIFAIGGLVTGLIMCAVGVVSHMAFAAVVVDNERAVSALGRSLRFCTENAGDWVKLYFTFVVLGVPLAIIQLIPAVTQISNKTISLGGGLISAVYAPYLTLLGAALAASLYLARRSDGPAEDGPRELEGD